MLPDMTLDDPQSILGVGADLVLTEDAPEEQKGTSDAGIDVVTIAPATSREDFTRLTGRSVPADGRRIRTRGEDRWGHL
ncbi:MAG: hypothetical protein ACLS8R_07000 [Anaeromassilibacillus sp.]